MADSPAGSESANDSGDDSQLTIRIPNPKVYMARQSQWKGRRGKPRCDHCRLNNLKCDRVLPTCNHCSYAAGRECKYTPLPTPAHRGIPRCDRCRLRNLKCDRNLPVCNHCLEDNETDCNYTPKKRHKVPSDHGLPNNRPVAPYLSNTASFLVKEQGREGQTPPPGSHGEPSSAVPTYENELRTEPLIRQYVPPHPPPPGGAPIDDDTPMDQDPDGSFQQAGPDGSFTWGMIVTTPHIDPWTHPSFVPLPEPVLRVLRAANAIEMPSRHHFDDALTKFLSALAPELRDTATFPADVYAELAGAVHARRVPALASARLQFWATCHHARSGSARRHLLLVPRDAFYHMHAADEEKLRLNYVLQTDGEGGDGGGGGSTTHHAQGSESAAVFERVPVQNQIYDVLVYAHRGHGGSAQMLFEVRRVGVATITWPMAELFIRICPFCKLRAKNVSLNGTGTGNGNVNGSMAMSINGSGINVANGGSGRPPPDDEPYYPMAPPSAGPQSVPVSVPAMKR